MLRAGRRSCAAALVLGALFYAPASAAEPLAICRVPVEFTRLDRSLTHVGARLAAHEPIKIVAIGSSSTAGAGASSPADSYPSRLAIELSRFYPDASITIVNRGINGQDAAEMVVRFARDVIEEKPDLVLWQLGTNAALRDLPVQQIGNLIEEGIRRLKATGADVLLIDPQFVPRVIAKSETEDMVKLIAASAMTSKISVFRRFAIMRYWREVGGMAFEAFTSPDGLHLNDWGYRCWAKLLGTAIVDAATRGATAQLVPVAARPNNQPVTH